MRPPLINGMKKNRDLERAQTPVVALQSMLIIVN